MKAKKTRPFLKFAAGMLSVVFLGLILGCLWAGGGILLSDNGEKLPIQTLDITIEIEHRNELTAQLRRFGDEHNFEILIREVKVYPNGIYIEMERSDLKIIAHDSPKSPEHITFGFYNQFLIPVSQAAVDDLVNDLKNFISEIPNVIFAEEK